MANPDRVVAVSRLADGTPDQAEGFEMKGVDTERVAADVQRPSKKSTPAKRVAAEAQEKETR